MPEQKHGGLNPGFKSVRSNLGLNQGYFVGGLNLGLNLGSAFGEAHDIKFSTAVTTNQFKKDAI